MDTKNKLHSALSIAVILLSLLVASFYIYLTLKEAVQPRNPKYVGNNFSKLNFAVDDIVLRQTKKLISNNNYIIENHLYFKNIKPFSADMKDIGTDYPISFRDKTGKNYSAKYFAEFDVMRVPVSFATLKRINLMVGIMVAFILLIVILITWQAFQLSRSFAAGDPFIRKNATRIWMIAFTIQLAPIAYKVFYVWLEKYMASSLNIRDFRLDDTLYPYSLFFIIAGLVMSSFAYSMLSGIKLKEDQDLTI